MPELTHFSLFSGIGGIDLAAEWAGWKTVGQCEIADYPYKVLCKHWPDVPKWRDIRDVTRESIQSRGIQNIGLLSGGFPCQPHSVAGKRHASSDERDLWPEYRRVIGEVKPRWVLGENVPGLLTSESGRFFREILRNLSELGYSVGWCTCGANEIGAFHRRDRVFIVAHSNSFRMEGSAEKSLLREPDIQVGQISDPFSEAERRYDAFESRLCRTLHGIPSGVDRVKALGNSVVPQQVYPILKAIHEIEVSK